MRKMTKDESKYYNKLHICHKLCLAWLKSDLDLVSLIYNAIIDKTCLRSLDEIKSLNDDYFIERIEEYVNDK